MGYHQMGSVRELFPITRTREASRAMVGAVGLRLWANIRQNTPIAHAEDNLGGLSAGEMGALRGGRKPGTLRKSILLSPILEAFGGLEITAFTDDEVAIFVEEDTRPHRIEPRNASVLAWMGAGGMQFAAGVNHPGTKGQHMFAIGVLLTEAEMDVIGAPILDAWESGAAFGAITEGIAMAPELDAVAA